MKTLFIFFAMVLSLNLFSQNPGDTIVVPTFNYSQTYGHPWDGTIRDTMIHFPDDPDVQYRQILMAYNIRCKDGNVSVPGNTNLGCGEWDYSCNTYITDSSRVDSVINFTDSHYISNYQGGTFYYVDHPLFDYYQHIQKEVTLNNINNETLSTVGSGNLELTNVIPADTYGGKSQYLFTKEELTNAGLTAGTIHAIILENTGEEAKAGYLKIRIKNTSKTELDANKPDLPGFFDGFTDVFYHDFTFVQGENRIQFYQPFSWNGTSNIIVEFSFTNDLPSGTLKIKGENTGNIYGIYSKNSSNIKALNGYVDASDEAFGSVSDQITISFWSKGDKDILPAKTSLFYGMDDAGRRQANLHLPWSDSKVYFDCGNDGSYDRISKLASADDYKGRWTHWAFTKNTETGEMKIYLDGELWQTGTGKTKLIDLVKFFIGGNGAGSLFYYGNIDEFRVWNKELDEQTIWDWMNRAVDDTHPFYDNLVAYYKFDEGSGTLVSDASPNGGSSEIKDFLYWVHQRGFDIFNGFEATVNRPDITFAQGNYDLTVTDLPVTDSVMHTPTIVKEYQVIPKYGGFQDDSIAMVSVNELWEAKPEYLYDPDGNLIDSTEVSPTGSIEVTQLSYYKRYPSKIEIMSLVTPYGIYLDLGEHGKTWLFDVTDYTPILKGRKRMTVERGGQWQEDMDIKFYFITGTPPRDVLDMRQIWRVLYKSFNSIHNELSYETRDVMMPAEGSAFKIRGVITGHGQEGEFIRRHHQLNINGGDIEYDWYVWNECSTIPIYPQGGTWIYDRAGWCPGNPTVINDFDITGLVTPGQTASIDYDIPVATGNSNYIVNMQLMTYGPPNFTKDAAIVKILKPNAAEASELRFNPACSFPEIVIQNTGDDTLTALSIEYRTASDISLNTEWSGALGFLEKDTVTLPVDDLSFWYDEGTHGDFTVNIHFPEDQNEDNNTLTVPYEAVDVYPEGSPITVKLWTNNLGWQTFYKLYKADGTVIFEKNDLDNSTLYEDEFNLEPGCYRLRIFDKGGDGLEFWANPGQGVGAFSIRNSDGETLYNFDPDFGSFAIHEFGIGNITRIDEKQNPFTVHVFPNPVQDKLKVNIKSSGKGTFRLTLFNLTMTPLIQKQADAYASEISEIIDMSQLAPGIYLLKAEYGNFQKTVKVVKE